MAVVRKRRIKMVLRWERGKIKWLNGERVCTMVGRIEREKV